MRSAGIVGVCALLATDAVATRRVVSHEAAGDGAEWPLKPFVVGALARPHSGADVATPGHMLEFGAGAAESRMRRRDRFAEWAHRMGRPGLPLVTEGGWNLVAKDMLKIGQRSAVLRASIMAEDGVETVVAVTVERATEKSQAMREAAIMERLSGDNFVHLYGWTENSDSVLLLSEPVGANFQSAVLEPVFEDVDVVRRVSLAMDLLEGLRHMAKEGIVHRAISPESLMIVESEPRQRLKIGDFSFACSAPDGPEELRASTEEEDGLQVGSLAHRAPEAWDGEWTPASDVYSAGMVLYQMLFDGALPLEFTTASEPLPWKHFDIERDEMLIVADFKAKESYDVWLSQVLKVTRAMLARDPAQRMTADEAYMSLKAISSLPTRPRKAHEVLRSAKSLAEVRVMLRNLELARAAKA